MYLSHIILRDNLIHHLLKRQDYSTPSISTSPTSPPPPPSSSNSGLITFSIVIGVITLLSILSGLIAYILRRKYYSRREEKNDLRINHIVNADEGEYNALDYYTNDYVDKPFRPDNSMDHKLDFPIKTDDNDEKQSVNMRNTLDAQDSDITGVDTVRSKISNRNYRIVGANRSDFIETDYEMSNIVDTTNNIDNGSNTTDLIDKREDSSNATDLIDKRENTGNKSDYSIIANAGDMAPNINNYRASNISNSTKNKKRQISQPTIMSSSIYNQERASALVNNLSRSTTFNVTRSAPSPPPPIPPVPAHIKLPNENNIKPFESLAPSTFYYLHQTSDNTNTDDSPTLRKSPKIKDNSNNDDHSHNNVNENFSNSEYKSNFTNPSNDLTNSNNLNHESENNLSNVFVRHLYGDYV